MVYDDLLKRYQEAGSEFLDAARTRAEELFRDLQRIGESTQSRVEDSRRNTDVVVELIRRELSTQLNQLSTATRSELGRIFDTLETMAKTAAANAPGTKKTPAPEEAAATPIAVEAKKGPATKKAAPRKAAATKKAAPRKAAATKKAAVTRTVPVDASTATTAGAKNAAPTKKAAAAKKAPSAKKAGGSAKAAAAASE